MHKSLLFVELFSLVFMVYTYNPYSLNPQNIYHSHSSHRYQLYPSYSNSYQQVATPLSPRFLFLMNLLNGTLPTIPRVQACSSLFNSDIWGSCLKFVSCILKGGKPAGTCNYGFDTCCVSFFGVNKLPVSTFTKRSTTRSPAMYSVKRASPLFCQIRVDFVDFDVGDVDVNGICNGGWNATGQANTNNLPSTICGLNTGQHVYLNFDGKTRIKMNVNWTSGETWTIKITQIPCNDQQNLAPTGCLQYFPESSGQVESFNFRTISSVPDASSVQTTYQLSNLDYYACIGTPTNTFSTITWTKGVGTTDYYFVLTNDIGLIPANIVGTVAVAEFDGDCTNTATGSLTNDYVEIMNGQFTQFDGTAGTETQYCGTGFPPAVTSTVKPFRLHVVTNGVENNRTEGSIGFSLSYVLS